ncbi:MAG TPA: alpha-L-fucosidase [Chitinophagaceae bacterium]
MNSKRRTLILIHFIIFHFTFFICPAQNNDALKKNPSIDEGKQRDRQAIEEARNGWWTRSMKNHDKRIQWWREARFGMFIHWGVYSLPGGEWKGKKVSGYAEHLMRKEKISREEYLELAHQFNPVKFNADEWVGMAKDAGMRYLVITAKHHDGFALYPSQFSEFTIAKQTPFQRDPMAELSAACKKQGLKFGFYYSHAFDWEHPDAPGNDWEYRNPGGDSNLFGGREWYNLHPDLLTKARKYVDEKAIPQIRELLQKYHPDILWFDTPQKLPLSENIRILKAIRELDSTVVVNGRLVRFDNVNFGDYRNTADRPAEFFPVTGDWEAIPTTNESYGYHKYDNSHKPVAHFVRLFASAVSRGGNLLMNIGPKGDGTFDEKDKNILKGISSWINKNRESIYEVKKSPLPMQSWGVTTANSKKVYLHVFDWPADGKLYVGGLNQPLSKAYLLSDPSKTFQVTKLHNDAVITVPRKMPDTMNTVIVISLDRALQPDSLRYISPNVTTRLLAYDAMQQGNGFSFGDGKTDRYYIEGWRSADQFLIWNIRHSVPAQYKLIIKYIAPKESAGGSYAVSVNDINVERKVQNTSSSNRIITEELFIIPFNTAAEHRLQIRPVTITKAELMKLLELQLVPVKQDVSLPAVFADAEKQTKVMLAEIPKAIAAGSSVTTGGTPGSAGRDLVTPRSLDSGRLRLVTSRDWTSGFFPGVLWYLYEYTRKNEWKEQAAAYTSLIEKEKTNGTTHDMGFKIYCSFGTGYALTKDQHYRDVIIESATTLTKRFNATAGVIRSWDHSKQKWDFPVIIDNMMNLELLFAATRLTGDSTFYRIAVSHANNTMKNHYRPDHSSYHVVDYDTTSTGKINKKTTHQGFSNESAWSRGQAWGLYGYTMCYRETKRKEFLTQAENIASFILKHKNFPRDGVPYWDFDAPGIPNEVRDASAGAIIASALYELSMFSKNGKEYRRMADRIVESLTRYYRSPVGENKGFILLHSTGARPSNSEVDVPLSYADYYYIEALLRMKKIKP